jgi:DSF synthase
MSAKSVPAISAGRDENDIIEHADRSAEFVVSPQFACHYDADEAVLWSSWMPRGIPSFNDELLHDLERGSQMIEGYFSGAGPTRPLDYIVLRSGVPGTFSVGGDLGYFQRLIVAQNRARLTEYARAAITVQYRNFTSHNLPGVTTVALLEGDALGGGFECALSCDLVIVEKQVKAGFPEVLFNMFPGMGGISFLTRRVGRSRADEIVRTGRQYTALELLELGAVDYVAEPGEGLDMLHKLMRRREHQKAGHAAMNAVDRLIRPLAMQELHDVAKIWVDCALKLSPRGLEWMQRLYQRQLSIFGRPLEVAGETAVANPISNVAAAA